MSSLATIDICLLEGMLLRILFTCLQCAPPSLRFKIYKFLRGVGQKLYGSSEVYPQRLPFNLYMKRSPLSSLEAQAMRIVKLHTNIPVPEVMDVVGDYIIMTRLPGDPLGTVFKYMDDEQVEEIQHSLATIVQQLRDIPSDAEGVVSGPLPTMPCCDLNRVDEIEFGPFPDVPAFHYYLYKQIDPRKADSIRETAALVHQRPYRVFFTHGDLNLRNILFKNGQVTGVVDWTCSGWYPEYWEIGKALYVHHNFQKWEDLWMAVLPGYERELDLEREMWNPY
jgi:aminoglycoside phosphotransferase (APT) family kinase protein